LSIVHGLKSKTGKRRITFPSFKDAGVYYRYGQIGMSFHDAVKEFELHKDGSPAGQRQLAGSVYDSRVPSENTPGQLCFIA